MTFDSNFLEWNIFFSFFFLNVYSPYHERLSVFYFTLLFVAMLLLLLLFVSVCVCLCDLSILLLLLLLLTYYYFFFVS